MNPYQTNRHAVVLGGSIAGLLAARVLSEHFARVTIVERDHLPTDAENRKGVPQGRHIHVLLTRGHDLLTHYFPDLDDSLVAAGARLADAGDSLRSYRNGGYALQFQSGLVAAFQSRALLESQIRQRVLARLNVALAQGAAAESLVASSDGKRVTGVVVRRSDGESGSSDHARDAPIEADLVVDATGRGSQAPKWLTALGYTAPSELTLNVDLAYTSRVYRRKAGSLLGADAVLVSTIPPAGKRGGGLLPLEGDRWMVTLGGYLGDHAPQDEQGFLEFARSLPVPDVYNAIADAEPLSAIAVHKFPYSRRRYYEKLKRVPDGFIVVGDALCSFNPIYGQGMTVAAIEAATLDECLRADQHDRLPQRFFQRVAKVVDVPWNLAAGADARYPEIAAPKRRGAALLNRYFNRLMRVSMFDADVSRAFLQVAHLTQPPAILFRPRIVARVLFAKPPSREAMRTQPRVAQGQQV